MSRPRQRQPHELLTRILAHLNNDYNAPATEAKQEVYGAWADAYTLREGFSPDPPKRSYYGAKDSLRNPHR